MEPETRARLDEKHGSGAAAESLRYEETGLERTADLSSPPNGSDIEKTAAAQCASAEGRIVWTPMTLTATICLAGLYVGSQLPLYFVGGSLGFISKELGGAEVAAWMPVSYGLVFAAVAPFCGYLQDLFGRRNITLIGGLTLIIGIIVIGTARSFTSGVVGMCFSGAGATIGELTALAGTSELVPVRQRGLYLAAVTAAVVPFTPYLLYTQLLGIYHTWRWGMWICLMWNGIFFVGIAVTYFPVSQTRLKGEARRKILKKIDYLGGLLSISGLTLFLIALEAGGYSHPWASAYVLAPLITGVLLIIAFVVWEWKFAPVPMVPHELFAGQRIVAMAYGIAFVAGINLFALLNFFPIVYSDLFDPDPIQIGLRGFAPGLSTMVGAVVVNASLSWFKGHNRELLVASSVIMTAFGGALICVTPETPRTAIALGTIAGVGIGGILVPAATVAITVVPDTVIATCVALSLSIRAVGGSIGYAIYYNVFINKLTPRLPTLIAKYAIAAGLPPSSAKVFVTTYLTAPANVTQIPGVTEAVVHGAQVGSRWAYAESLKYVWITSIPFGVCAVIASCCIGNIGGYMTGRVAARLEH